MEKVTSQNKASYMGFLKDLKTHYPLIRDTLLVYGKFIFDFLLGIVAKLETTELIYGGIALLYWLSPIDLIPDFIPIVGYIDDMLVGLFCLMKILNKNPQIEAELKKGLEEKGLSYDDLKEKYSELLNKVSFLSQKIEEVISKNKNDAEEAVQDKEKFAKTVVKAKKEINKNILNEDDLTLLGQKLDKLLGDGK